MWARPREVMATTQDLIDAAVLRTPTDGETLVVQNHLTQVLTFMLKSGIRVFPLQDGQLKQREKFIAEQLQRNRLELYLWGIASMFLTAGSLLWYLRPVGEDGYEIHWYVGGKDPERRQYRAVYEVGGRALDYVVIRYSFMSEERGGVFTGTASNNGNLKERWVRLIVSAEQIIEEQFYTKPSLDLTNPTGMQGAPIKRTPTVNSLGFIPCAESVNDPLFPGDSGHGEFDAITNQVEVEDDLRSSMVDNAFLFNSQTLVTTKPKEQILESMGEQSYNSPPRAKSWAGSQGYYSVASPGPGGLVPFVSRAGAINGRRRGRQERIARIIGQVREDERIGYVSSNPLNADIWRFAQEYREALHQSLGSIDPLSYRYTDWQSLRGLVGQVECTAKRKCLSLFTYGLCEILRMAIVVEERMFLTTYKNWMAVNVFGFPPEQAAQVAPQITDAQVMENFYSQSQLPPGVEGLPPYGDRTVRWQWLGPLFEPDSREKQVATINARNLQEAGVGSIHALRELFPGKTDKEIKAMLTGIPLRYAQDVSSTIGALIQLQQQLMQTPDPNDPMGQTTLGMTASLVPLIQQLIGNFNRQINNEELYDPTDPNTEPLSPRNFNVEPPIAVGSIPILGPTDADWNSQLPNVSGTVSSGPLDPATFLAGLGQPPNGNAGRPAAGILPLPSPNAAAVS